MRHRSWFSAVLPLLLLFALPAFADEETQVFVPDSSRFLVTIVTPSNKGGTPCIVCS